MRGRQRQIKKQGDGSFGGGGGLPFQHFEHPVLVVNPLVDLINWVYAIDPTYTHFVDKTSFLNRLLGLPDEYLLVSPDVTGIAQYWASDEAPGIPVAEIHQYLLGHLESVRQHFGL